MPNDPYLDASVRWRIRAGLTREAEPRYREVAESLRASGLATEVVRKIGSGKEADVYLARDGGELVAIKVYRTYRTSHHVGREMKLDSIGHLAAWEYDLLVYAWRDGAPVPRPRRREEHTFSMQYFGSIESAAPRLKEYRGDGIDRLADRTVSAVERLAEAGVVHTDLSPYNILVDRELPWIIDVGKCLRVDRLGSPPWMKVQDAHRALLAGLSHLTRYFATQGVDLDGDAVVARVMARIDRFGRWAPDG